LLRKSGIVSKLMRPPGRWGSASPFSFGWWAIVQDDYRVDRRVLPEAGEHQRLPALSGRRAAGRLADVLAARSKPDGDGVKGAANPARVLN
jgi:hypothetical protein